VCLLLHMCRWLAGGVAPPDRATVDRFSVFQLTRTASCRGHATKGATVFLYCSVELSSNFFSMISTNVTLDWYNLYF